MQTERWKPTECFLFYRKNADMQILDDMAWLMESRNKTDVDLTEKRKLFIKVLATLYEYAGENGFYGNLWHCYLTEILVYHENPYTIACEMRGNVEGTLNRAVCHDLMIFQELFRYDLEELGKELEMPFVSLILDYEASQKEAIKYNRFIIEKICELAKKLSLMQSVEEFKFRLDHFYKSIGVGVFGLHKAFRVEHEKEGLQITPIYNIAITSLDDIVGYEIPKQKLIENTEAFLQGKKANNCLIYGDAGTGKSSSIRAILNQYYDSGLRMIEVYKHQYRELNELIDRLKCRNYKFIIYMDDLSFEEFETDYKYLKAVIEGGLESKPQNVLIYATSNRRHLVRENYSDREEIKQDMHGNETVQEKLSLFARFGVSIYFGAPDKKEFEEIVLALAKRYKLDIPKEKLLLEANRWELTHAGLSGRTARQFIDAVRAKESL